LKDKTVNVEVENINELKRLLQKATDQLEQLEITLSQLESFKVKSKVN
jgi:hypothetical protein